MGVSLAVSPELGKRGWIGPMSQPKALFPGSDCGLGPPASLQARDPPATLPRPLVRCCVASPSCSPDPASAAAASPGGRRDPGVPRADGLVGG